MAARRRHDWRPWTGIDHLLDSVVVARPGIRSGGWCCCTRDCLAVGRCCSGIALCRPAATRQSQYFVALCQRSLKKLWGKLFLAFKMNDFYLQGRDSSLLVGIRVVQKSASGPQIGRGCRRIWWQVVGARPWLIGFEELRSQYCTAPWFPKHRPEI